MSRPLLLDLGCGAGGAARGYDRAGFDIVGVDIKPQPRYPYLFVQADGIEFLRRNWRHFDAVHMSWPCQHWTPLHARHPEKVYPRLVDVGREMANETGLPWVMENVMTAPLDKARSVVLCGEMFQLRTIRHRRFEPSPGLRLIAPPHPRPGELIGEIRCDSLGHRRPTATKRRRERWDQGWHVSITGDVGTYVGPAAMGIDWMTGDELCEAIPPVYAEHVGAQLLEHVLAVSA